MFDDLVPFLEGAALVITLILIVLFRRSQKREREWFHGKTIVEGTVRSAREQEYGFWSAVEYRGPDGHRYQITGDFDHTPADVGRTVRVAYDPAMPSEARLVKDDDA